MPDELDLTGRSGAADDDTPRRRRQRRTQQQREEEARGGSNEGATDSELRHQLNRAFQGLIRGREAKGDEELADALKEEGDAMTESFVTLTDNVKPLRMPLVIILNLVITLLAFGRVGGILLTRLTSWRVRRQEAAQQAEAEYNAAVEAAQAEQQQ